MLKDKYPNFEVGLCVLNIIENTIVNKECSLMLLSVTTS